MIDDKRIDTKIRDVQHYRKEIERFLPKDAKEYYRSDVPIKRLVERDLGLISDIEYDLLALLNKGLQIAIIGDESNMLQKLEGKLGKKLTAKIGELRVLRNSLVHAYAEYNYDAEVYKHASDLGSVEEFVATIRKLVKNDGR